MQLACKPLSSVPYASGVFILAGKLVRHLDTPLPKQQAYSFEQELDRSRSCFPLFAAAVGKSQLYTLTPEKRRDLKLSLLEDVKAFIARISEDIDGDKVLEALPLPTDPEECLQRLDEISTESYEKIREIQKTISRIGPACEILQRIIENKRTIKEDFNEDIYTSMPGEVLGKKPSAKKARH